MALFLSPPELFTKHPARLHKKNAISRLTAHFAKAVRRQGTRAGVRSDRRRYGTFTILILDDALMHFWEQKEEEEANKKK